MVFNMSYFGTSDFILDIAKGKVPGHSLNYVHGYNESIGTTEQLIWPLSGNVTLSSTASNLLLTSTDNTDTQNVFIEWLDGNYDKQSGIYTLNGNTPVTIGNGLRVNRMYVNDSTETAGDLYVANATGHTGGVPDLSTSIVSYVAASDQTRSMCLYTVPAGYTAFGLSGYFSAAKGGDNEVYWNVNNTTSNFTNIKTNILYIYQSTFEVDFKFTAIPEKTDVYITCKTSTGTDKMSSRIPFIIADNTKL